eukprot:7317660-Alexandrium_andersonii.AAC.1
MCTRGSWCRAPPDPHRADAALHARAEPGAEHARADPGAEARAWPYRPRGALLTVFDLHMDDKIRGVRSAKGGRQHMCDHSG